MNTNLATVNNIGYNYIYDYYETFLGKYSEKTAKNYKSDLDMFFDFVYNKDYKTVMLDDLNNTKSLDIQRYFVYLKENYVNSTIRRKIISVRRFFEYVANDHDVNVKIFNNIDLPKADLTSNQYGELSWNEAVEIWEYAEKKFDKELSMLIKLACITSIRLNALLELKWDVHWFKKNENGVIVNFIDIAQKRNRYKVPVSDDFYEELQNKLGNTGKLFPRYYDKKVNKCLKEILNDLGIDERRNIKFHSFKSVGVMRALEKTGNMYKAKEQGHHKSMATSEKYYLKYKECLTDMTSYSLEKDIDSSVFNNYSKEELLTAISKMSERSKFELMRLLEK